VFAYLAFTIDAAAQDTQGFFLNDWQAKKAVIPPFKKMEPASQKADVSIMVDAKNTHVKISRYLYGNNTNPYMTQIVTEPKLMKQLQQLSPNILRFPGGNISNVYFWDAAPFHKPMDVPDTILYGDKRKPKREKFWYGKDENPNSLTVENYYKLLQQTNSTGTICVNAGYARYGTGKDPIATAAHYAANWVRYDKGRTKFWEVGNEDYGNWQAGYRIDTAKNKDGQPTITNGKMYGKIYKAFHDSMHAAAREIGAAIHVGATIIETGKHNAWESDVTKNWNSSFFSAAKNAADFFVIHSYFTPYQQDSKPDEILNLATLVSNNMMQSMQEMAQQNGVELKPIALTEWNIFAEGSKQQISYINGMHAAIVLGELAKLKYGMACRWDLANGYGKGNDHGMFNKGDEPNMPKWSARPVFYYMYYFQKFFGDHLASASSSDSNVLIYASTFSDGKIGLVVINKDSTTKTIEVNLSSTKQKGNLYCYTLTGGNDGGLFSGKVLINGIGPTLPAGGPDNFENIPAWQYDVTNGKVKVAMAAKAVDYMLIDEHK